jgi:DNA-binding NarL/FixJ family response regulator
MKTRIGIVEDNLDIRNTLAGWINASADCVCVCACPNAESALIEIPRAQPDVVLMDIQLPGESGIVCTARLRDLLPNLLVIVLTVYRDRDLLFQALKAGACGYLLKRSTPDELLRAIAEVRTGGAPMTSEIARMLVDTFRAPMPEASAGRESAAEAELSKREMEILSLVSAGLANKEIAAELNISFFTVRAHLRKIYEKLHVRCRAEAVAKCFKPKS